MDAELLPRAIEGCDVVFHLAGLKHAGRSFEERLRYFDVNGSGTARVAEACHQSGAGTLVYASTGHVYGTPQTIPVDEDHPTRPLSIYAASKLAGEAAAFGYAAAAGLRTVIARLANLYGNPIDEDTIVGRAVGLAVRGEDIRLRNLAVVRDFVHMDDAAEALVRLAEFAQRGPSGRCTIVNVTNATPVSAGQIAELAADLAVAAGKRRPAIESSGGPEALPKLVLSGARLESLLGWLPQIDIASGIRSLIPESVCT
jgi:nucleoside-diphosphate-sugar epimerase